MRVKGAFIRVNCLYMRVKIMCYACDGFVYV